MNRQSNHGTAYTIAVVPQLAPFKLKVYIIGFILHDLNALYSEISASNFDCRCSQFAIPFSPRIFAPTLSLLFNLFVPGTETPAHGQVPRGNQIQKRVKRNWTLNATQRRVESEISDVSNVADLSSLRVVGCVFLYFSFEWSLCCAIINLHFFYLNRNIEFFLDTYSKHNKAKSKYNNEKENYNRIILSYLCTNIKSRYTIWFNIELLNDYLETLTSTAIMISIILFT